MTDTALSPERAVELVNLHGGLRAASRATGFAKTTLRRRLAEARAGEDEERDFAVRAPAGSPDVPIPELIDRLTRDYERKAAHAEATRLLTVEVAIDGPIGLLGFGDPHLDSPLCNWPALRRDIELVKNNEALLAINIGDAQDNWSGKLAHLASNNAVTQNDANRLARWFLEEVDWLLFLLGNHCFWQGDGALIKWAAERVGVLSADWSQRLCLKFPNGFQYLMNHKHGLNGHSQWHPTHGHVKEMRFGARAHLHSGGHTHKSGVIGPVVDPNSGIWQWGLNLGSYKDLSDHFGKRLGGGEQNAFPSAVVVVNPDGARPGNVTNIFPDTEEGADYLGFARRRWAQGKRLAA